MQLPEGASGIQSTNPMLQIIELFAFARTEFGIDDTISAERRLDPKRQLRKLGMG
jgi:hypothetical protein